jgi:hypothetical protein
LKRKQRSVQNQEDRQIKPVPAKRDQLQIHSHRLHKSPRNRAIFLNPDSRLLTSDFCLPSPRCPMRHVN